jgi:hypothetical protein
MSYAAIARRWIILENQLEEAITDRRLATTAKERKRLSAKVKRLKAAEAKARVKADSAYSKMVQAA